MKITVLGSNGMAGHVAVSYLRQQGHEVDAVDRARLDVENTNSVTAFFEKLNTDFVVNCIGLLVGDGMKNFAVIDNGKVINLIVAKSLKIAEEATGLICAEYTETNLADIGWSYVDGVFIAPVVNETIPQ